MNDVTALWLPAAPTLPRQPEKEQTGGMGTRKAGEGDWGRVRASGEAGARAHGDGSGMAHPLAQGGNQDQQARTLSRLGVWQLQVGSSPKPGGAMGVIEGRPVLCNASQEGRRQSLFALPATPEKPRVRGPAGGLQTRSASPGQEVLVLDSGPRLSTPWGAARAGPQSRVQQRYLSVTLGHRAKHGEVLTGLPEGSEASPAPPA